MRALVFAVLLVLAVAAALSGHVHVALALGGVKALLVGVEFMELRHAARRHALGFAALVAGLVLVLVLIAGG